MEEEGAQGTRCALPILKGHGSAIEIPRRPGFTQVQRLARHIAILLDLYRLIGSKVVILGIADSRRDMQALLERSLIGRSQ